MLLIVRKRRQEKELLGKVYPGKGPEMSAVYMEDFPKCSFPSCSAVFSSYLYTCPSHISLNSQDFGLMGSCAHTLKFYFMFGWVLVCVLGFFGWYLPFSSFASDWDCFPGYHWVTYRKTAGTVTKTSLLGQWMWTSFLIQTEDDATAWCSSAP